MNSKFNSDRHQLQQRSGKVQRTGVKPSELCDNCMCATKLGLGISESSKYAFAHLGCAVVQWLACWTANQEVRGSNLGQGRIWVQEFCSTCTPANSAMMTEYTTIYHWLEDDMARERTDHPSPYGLFRAICSNPDHVLRHYFTPKKPSGYNLRPRALSAHIFNLPPKDPWNFVSRSLYGVLL